MLREGPVVIKAHHPVSLGRESPAREGGRADDREEEGGGRAVSSMEEEADLCGSSIFHCDQRLCSADVLPSSEVLCLSLRVSLCV